MSQPPEVTFLGPQKTIPRRMASPGSEHADHEPTATVLTAGSTKQATPHYGCTICAAIRMSEPRCWRCCSTSVAPGRQQTPPCALCGVPEAVVKCLRKNEC